MHKKNAVTISTELTSNHCLRVTSQRPGLLSKYRLPPLQGGFCSAKACAESVLHNFSKQLTQLPQKRQFKNYRTPLQVCFFCFSYVI